MIMVDCIIASPMIHYLLSFIGLLYSLNNWVRCALTGKCFTSSSESNESESGGVPIPITTQPLKRRRGRSRMYKSDVEKNDADVAVV